VVGEAFLLLAFVDQAILDPLAGKIPRVRAARRRRGSEIV
jgi:hypothetical protein